MPERRTDPSGFIEGLGAFLVRRGTLNESGLDRARRVQEETGDRLDHILTKIGLVSEKDMAEAFAEGLALPLVAASDFPGEAVRPEQVSASFLKASRVLPLAETGEGLALAMADPLDDYPKQAIALSVGQPVLPCVAVPSDLDAAIERLYSQDGSALGSLLKEHGEASDEDTLQDIERLRDSASEAPVIRLVTHIINRAVEARASDIHIEPFEGRLRVRYRVDGVLREQDSPPNALRQAVVSRIKIMARLNIAETRLPQDGRIKTAIRGRDIDFRVSTVPTMHGESVVLRVLDRDAVKLDLAGLGLDPETLEAYLQILERPHGIVLVTGPTGSGKTTTLYASLVRLNDGRRKMLTVEDPIEYQLDGINQVQVQPQIGLSFANSLRAFLRQDPDIMMIGEIRDLETAEIAVQAALTGHLVLSTLHTNDAAGTVSRLLDMGVEDFLLASTLNGVTAQRLVRRLCPHCREVYEALPEVAEQLDLRRFTNGAEPRLYRAMGCARCIQTGYLGRTAIQETLVMSDEVRRLLLKHADAQDLRRVAVAEGMRSMFQDGLRKAVQGITSIEEVMRVTREV